MKKVRKAVIPAAGLGTRFLPATKAFGEGNVTDCLQANNSIYCCRGFEVWYRRHSCCDWEVEAFY